MTEVDESVDMDVSSVVRSFENVLNGKKVPVVQPLKRPIMEGTKQILVLR